MRWFRGGAGRGGQRPAVVPGRCGFCEKAADPRSLTEVCAAADGRGAGYCCRACEERYAAFEARLEYAEAPPGRRWLRSDAGTAHAVLATRSPFRAVHAVVEGLRDRIRDVPRATARMATARLSVCRTGEPVCCDSREEAIAAVSGLIAEELAHHRASVERFGGGREWAAYAVSLFGEGHGVLLSRVSTEGDRLAQRCFLVEFGHAVHHYTAWLPSGHAAVVG